MTYKTYKTNDSITIAITIAPIIVITVLTLFKIAEALKITIFLSAIWSVLKLNSTKNELHYFQNSFSVFAENIKTLLIKDWPRSFIIVTFYLNPRCLR